MYPNFDPLYNRNKKLNTIYLQLPIQIGTIQLMENTTIPIALLFV
jgi:hypothetical protein